MFEDEDFTDEAPLPSDEPKATKRKKGAKKKATKMTKSSTPVAKKATKAPAKATKAKPAKKATKAVAAAPAKAAKKGGATGFISNAKGTKQPKDYASMMQRMESKLLTASQVAKNLGDRVAETDAKAAARAHKLSAALLKVSSMAC